MKTRDLLPCTQPLSESFIEPPEGANIDDPDHPIQRINHLRRNIYDLVFTGSAFDGDLTPIPWRSNPSATRSVRFGSRGYTVDNRRALTHVPHSHLIGGIPEYATHPDAALAYVKTYGALPPRSNRLFSDYPHLRVIADDMLIGPEATLKAHASAPPIKLSTTIAAYALPNTLVGALTAHTSSPLPKTGTMYACFNTRDASMILICMRQGVVSSIFALESSPDVEGGQILLAVAGTVFKTAITMYRNGLEREMYADEIVKALADGTVLDAERKFNIASHTHFMIWKPGVNRLHTAPAPILKIAAALERHVTPASTADTSKSMVMLRPKSVQHLYLHSCKQLGVTNRGRILKSLGINQLSIPGLASSSNNTDGVLNELGCILVTTIGNKYAISITDLGERVLAILDRGGVVHFADIFSGAV